MDSNFPQSPTTDAFYQSAWSMDMTIATILNNSAGSCAQGEIPLEPQAKTHR